MAVRFFEQTEFLRLFCSPMLSVLLLPARLSSGKSIELGFSFMSSRIAFSVMVTLANLTRFSSANSSSSNTFFCGFKLNLASFCRSISSRRKFAIFSSRLLWLEVTDADKYLEDFTRILCDVVTELRDLKLSMWLKVCLLSRYFRDLVRTSSFLCVKSSNQCSKTALSDSREVKKNLYFWRRRLFASILYNFEAIFLILTVQSFLSMASSMHSWFMSNSFSSLVLASVRRLILSEARDG